MNKRDPNPATKVANPDWWNEGTTRFVDLGAGCFISIDDDPNLLGGYVATVRVDNGGYSVFEATRGEIHELDEAKTWALAVFLRLGAIADHEVGVAEGLAAAKETA